MATASTRAKRLLLWSTLTVWAFALVEASTAGYFLLGFSRIYYRPLYLERRNDSILLRTEHDDWGAWRKPSRTGSHIGNCFSVTYRSNSYGARDRERSITATTKRVLMLGDSFVEGYALDEEERLSNLLERHLGWETLNFGAAGQLGPLQYEILYKQLASRFAHDLVIIGFLPKNDFTDNDAGFHRGNRNFSRRYRPYYSKDGGVFYPRPRPRPDEKSVFAESSGNPPEGRRLSQNLRRLFWLYGFYKEIRFVLEDPGPSDYLGYFETDEVRISRAAESILAIQKAATPRKMLVFFIPDLESWRYVESHPGSYDGSVVVKLRAMFEDNGIRTVDLLKEFIDRGLRKESLFLACDGHWSGAGNQAAFAIIQPLVSELLRLSPASR